MSRAEATKLGPFIGGLNIASDASAIDNAELSECINFEVDLDGSLVSRPPISETTNNSGSWTERIVIIGRGTFPGGTYVIGSNTNGTYAFNGTTWTLIKAGLVSSIALQYGDYIWIVPKPGSPQQGGRWSPTVAFVTDASMPYGESAIFHKTRLFIVPGPNATTNTARLSFTETITSSTLTWSGVNIIDVSPGDGQNLNDLAIYNDNIVLFKDDSTYVLAYDLFPADAVLRVINSKIGSSTVRCVASYENSLFTLHKGSLYEMSNYEFKDISIKVPFVYDVTSPAPRSENVFICIVGDRLLLRFFNKVYSYSLKVRVWSEWKSESPLLHNFGPLVELPVDTLTGVPRMYIGGSSVSTHENVYIVKEFHDALTTEKTLTTSYPIKCRAKTKTFDFDVPFTFKRLMWWGADIYAFANVTGTLEPIVSSSTQTWGALQAYTWSELETWATPTASIRIVDEVPVSTLTGRIFIKFLKSIRFRQTSFKIALETDGSTSQGPCRLFSLAAIVGLKQIVTKDMN